MLTWLGPQDRFPDPETAARHPNGLLAAGGDIDPARLLEAYRQGIFPWFGEGDPVLWWSPDPRTVLYPAQLHVRRSLAKRLRNVAWDVRADTCFDRVMEACAEPRADQEGTWITARMREAYGELARMGLAHSVETWLDGELVGGLYGVALGRMFFGESMFSRVSDASKVAFVHLVANLRAWGFQLIDCQMRTRLLQSFGARDLARREFTRAVSVLVDYPHKYGSWRLDLAPEQVRANQAGDDATQ